MPIQDLIIPPPNPVGQAELILKSAGLQLLKPKFFKVNTDQIAIEQSDIPDKISWLNTPIFDTFIVNAFSYTNDEGINVQIRDSYMFETALVTCHQAKNIVKTQVAGRKGRVKEYISDDDYEITINGMIVGRYANLPPDITDKIRIMEILKAPVAIPISCSFLDMFQINSVVIEDYEFTQIEGTRNAIGITIKCSSDEPFEIKYTDAKVKSVPSFI
jgi:hypothetical protein